METVTVADTVKESGSQGLRASVTVGNGEDHSGVGPILPGDSVITMMRGLQAIRVEPR